jgi:hypothetical protein
VGPPRLGGQPLGGIATDIAAFTTPFVDCQSSRWPPRAQRPIMPAERLIRPWLPSLRSDVKSVL